MRDERWEVCLICGTAERTDSHILNGALCPECGEMRRISDGYGRALVPRYDGERVVWGPPREPWAAWVVRASNPAFIGYVLNLARSGSSSEHLRLWGPRAAPEPAKFDKAAYQREYMRKKRAAAKGSSP
jgi:hypothetical protein